MQNIFQGEHQYGEAVHTVRPSLTGTFFKILFKQVKCETSKKAGTSASVTNLNVGGERETKDVQRKKKKTNEKYRTIYREKQQNNY